MIRRPRISPLFPYPPLFRSHQFPPPIDSTQSGREVLRPVPSRNSMKLAYFDCFSGISGDMTLGALADAGYDVELLRAGLTGLQVPAWTIAAAKLWTNGMYSTYVLV